MKLAIISDIHEDYESLKRAIKKIQKRNCDQIICLGDISGFSVPYYTHFNTRNAHQCLQLIKEHCDVVIAGNHDLNAAGKLPALNPGFKYPSDWFELDYHQKLEISGGKVWLYDHDELNPLYTREDIGFIKNLPESAVLKAEHFNILLTHYVYPNITGSTTQKAMEFYEFSDHQEFMAKHECQLGFCGHAHVADLVIVTKDKMAYRKYRKLDMASAPICFMVPPIVNSHRAGRFLIFDTLNLKVELVRI